MTTSNESASNPDNRALWLIRPGAFAVGPAPYTPPGADEVVVRTRAVGINLIDGLSSLLYRIILPWVAFPAVVGSDVAGEIVEVGANVAGLQIGDRVLGHASGIEKGPDPAGTGAFQHYVVLQPWMVAKIPDTLSFAQAAVLPLQLSTAASGMFQQDGLGLSLPSGDSPTRAETVLVWGGSTGVGSNAIQLARNAGYRVIATGSPRNFDYLRSLGASDVVDRSSRTAVAELVGAIGEGPLAGSVAIGSGSLSKVMKVAARVPGTRRVTTAAPALLVRLASLHSPRAVRATGIWGGSLRRNEVGPAIYNDFLPIALASGGYHAAPPADVVGTGLDDIPAALKRLRKGVSAKKLVVVL